ncbi:caspase family protein [Streptomyces sp. LN699]|uniref:caspase family protein n=1 Tax=Streptomyces sp. LN699 TaxID=3112981 RepID=UPI00372315F9
MGTVYALLVGIDEYRIGVRARLRGCVNDVVAAGPALERRAPGRLRALTLLNGEATVAAVEEAVRTHLGQAGPGDTALLWFSGHGTEYAAATPQELRIEPTGRCQAVVCADGPLPDKRLGALLDSAATAGGHVVAVLDCCFSGGASREEGTAARYLPPLPDWEPPPASRDAVGPDPRPHHLLLAASRIGQLSHERRFDAPGGPVVHGVFSHALLDALRGTRPAVTGRELLAAADAGVRRVLSGQQPVLFPAEPGGLADRPVLPGPSDGGAGPSPYLLREGPQGWEVDCGRVHGLTGGAGTEFAAAEGVVRVRAVRADRCLVDPDGWTPEPGSVRPVALSALALPPAAVVLDGEDVALPPSPLLRPVAADSVEARSARVWFRVEVRGARARVLRRDGSPYVDPLPLAGAADAARLTDCLARLTHWHRIRDLDAGLSPLAGRVRVEVVPWGRAEPLRPDGNGEIALAYDGPRAPWVTVRLRNTGPRPLWCVLVNLDDRFGAGSSLFPGQFIGGGMTGHALDGDPIRMVLPASRTGRTGAFARDWLTLVVAEGELNTVPFHLDRWDPLAGSHRSASGPPADGLLRLAAPRSRDMVAARPAGAGQWAASTLALRTSGPA